MTTTESNGALLDRMRAALYRALTWEGVGELPGNQEQWDAYWTANKQLREALASPAPAASDSRGSGDDVTGAMWSAGRRAFTLLAERFAQADNSDRASIVADTAPDVIYKAMLAAAPAPPAVINSHPEFPDNSLDGTPAVASGEPDREARIRYLGLMLLSSAHEYRKETELEDEVLGELDGLWKKYGARFENDWRDGAKQLASVVPLWPPSARELAEGKK